MSDVSAALFFLAGALLALSGVAKLRSPNPTSAALRSVGLPERWSFVRAFGAAEVLVGGFALARPSALAASAVAAFYLAFATFIGLLLAAKVPGASCGCAGAREAPPSLLHVALNLVAAGTAALAAFDPPPNLVRFALDSPLNGVPVLGLMVVTGYLAVLATAPLPEL